MLTKYAAFVVRALLFGTRGCARACVPFSDCGVCVGKSRSCAVCLFQSPGKPEWPSALSPLHPTEGDVSSIHTHTQYTCHYYAQKRDVINLHNADCMY